MEEINKNKYFLEFRHEKYNFDELGKFLDNYEYGSLKQTQLVMYVKYINGDDVEFKIKKEIEIFINYEKNMIKDKNNNYNYKSNIDIGINIPKRGKSNIRETLENVKKYIVNNINSKDIKINDMYYEDEKKRPNIKTHICSLRPILNNITKDKLYPIIRINKEDLKRIWTGDEIEYEEKTNIREFIERYKEIKDKGLKCFPKLRLILKVEDRYNKDSKKYIRYLTLRYNILQLVYTEDISFVKFTNN